MSCNINGRGGDRGGRSECSKAKKITRRRKATLKFFRSSVRGSAKKYLGSSPQRSAAECDISFLPFLPFPARFFWRLTIQFSRRYKLDECSTLCGLLPAQNCKKNCTRRDNCLSPEGYSLLFLGKCFLPLFRSSSSSSSGLDRRRDPSVHPFDSADRSGGRGGGKRGLKRNFFLHFRQINVSVFFSNVVGGGGRCRSFRPRPIRLACKASHTSPFSQKSRLSRVGSHLVMEFANQ